MTEPYEEPFKIGGYKFSIFKSEMPDKEKPYRIYVENKESDSHFWMDKGMELKSVALCYYSILLYLQDNF